ncbi:Lrp/AsnC family transcriptional regulator [Caballeronia sp. LZ033]|uniref:Lrp/AsnC family transcriptional regulator n=1 Tax=Caballeronia sp. LZ033 TaxID=3038566 RepID=UPI002856186A|nr:Lrp/AsnC family transcriptional regulator [Caballeronia sp. LZ033]MDR5815613.1 Lrp/AsnC family transcriptional regulator [Caballeronia sp. LZ033]
MSTNRSRPVMDPVDRSMLRLLQNDGTLSNAALGEQLSLSVTPCWRRRKHLEDQGVITGYQANLNRRAIGLDLLAFVHIRIDIHSDKTADNFEAVMRGRPEVLSCHKITGDADYILQVVTPDLDAYGDFIERVLRKQAGIASIQSSVALREVKSSWKYPIPDES